MSAPRSTSTLRRILEMNRWRARSSALAGAARSTLIGPCTVMPRSPRSVIFFAARDVHRLPGYIYCLARSQESASIGGVRNLTDTAERDARAHVGEIFLDGLSPGL